MNQEQLEKILVMIETMSEAIVKQNQIIGDLTRSNVHIRERLNQLEKESR